jgi:hypothetical protein
MENLANVEPKKLVGFPIVGREAQLFMVFMGSMKMMLNEASKEFLQLLKQLMILTPVTDEGMYITKTLRIKSDA